MGKPEERWGEWAAARAAALAEPRAAMGPYPPVAAGPARAGGLGWPSADGKTLAAVVTLGPALEAEVRRLFGQGRAGQAVMLDAAGNRLLAEATREAAHGLSGAWLSVGCHGLPLSLLPGLVRAAGAGTVGVEVLPGGMVGPEKTVVGLIVPGEAGLAGGAGAPAECRRCGSALCPWRAGDEP